MVEDGCELAFPSSLYEIMNSFSQTTYRVGLEGLPHLQDERIPLMVWQSCGFTVHSIVVSAREAEKALFGSLSSRQNDCLSTFIRFCGVVGSNFGEPKVIRSHSLKLLSTILQHPRQSHSPLDVLGPCHPTPLLHGLQPSHHHKARLPPLSSCQRLQTSPGSDGGGYICDPRHHHPLHRPHRSLAGGHGAVPGLPEELCPLLSLPERCRRPHRADLPPSP